MKKLLLTLVGVICSLGLWAESDIVYSDGSTLGNSATLKNGITIAISGNSSKNWSSGNGDITISTTAYKTLKNSNGAQNTITAPEGKSISNITFYVVTNDDTTNGKLQEFDGAQCSDAVASLKDYTKPTVISKDLTTPKNSVTFTFGTKQVCFIAVVTYESNSTETPSFTTNLSTTAYEAVATKEFSLSVVAKDFTSLQWYSCDDAQGTNAKAITGETKATYKFTPAEVGTQYFYCVATNDNATGNKTATSNIATVVASQATTSVVTWKNTNGWGMRSVKAGSAEYKNSGVDIDNGTELTFLTDLGAGYSHEWYVNGAKVAATGGTANANTSLTITVNGDTDVESRYTPFKKFTFTDNAKAKAYADADGKITLSENNFSYAEGKTVDYWTNGSDKYYVGTEYTLTQDVTLAPHFVDNTVTLGNEETTVTWSFAYKADNTGCPVFTSLQGAGNTVNYPVTAVVKGTSLDVNMVVDATSGKIDNERRLTSTNTQTNTNTKFTIPAIKGMIIVYTANGALKVDGKAATTIAGSSDYALSNSNKTATYKYEGEKSTIDIIVGADNQYCESIVVTYPTTEFVPAEPAEPIVNSAAVKTIAYNTDGNTINGNSKTWSSDGFSLETKGVNSNDNTLMKLSSSFAISIPDEVTITKVVIKGKSTSTSATTVTCGQSSDSNNFTTSIAEYTYNITEPTAGQDLTFTTNKELAVECIELYVGDGASGITLTTTANMAGYRSFYDAAKSYTTDANTKAYVASEQNTDGDIVLTSIGNKVPSGTPVILVTKATAEADRTFKMVLTEAENVDAFDGTNLLQVTTAVQEVDGYRLGCKDGIIGFYKYATTAPAGIVYLAKPAPAAKLSFIFDENTATGVNAIQSANDVKVRKAIVNGRLVIVTANGTFTPAGAAIK